MSFLGKQMPSTPVVRWHCCDWNRWHFWGEMPCSCLLGWFFLTWGIADMCVLSYLFKLALFASTCLMGPFFYCCPQLFDFARWPGSIWTIAMMILWTFQVGSVVASMIPQSRYCLFFPTAFDHHIFLLFLSCGVVGCIDVDGPAAPANVIFEL